jgi:alpha-L-fucosidase 2
VLDTHLARVVNPNLSANFGGMAEWEIDGNLGLTAAICEMLLQSQAGGIELLPALPAAWPSGHVRGLRARGAFEVDLEWAQGRLASAAIRSDRGGRLVVQSGPRSVPLDTRPGETVRLDGSLARR